MQLPVLRVAEVSRDFCTSLEGGMPSCVGTRNVYAPANAMAQAGILEEPTKSDEPNSLVYTFTPQLEDVPSAKVWLGQRYLG